MLLLGPHQAAAAACSGRHAAGLVDRRLPLVVLCSIAGGCAKQQQQLWLMSAGIMLHAAAAAAACKGCWWFERALRVCCCAINITLQCSSTRVVWQERWLGHGCSAYQLRVFPAGDALRCLLVNWP